MAIFHIPDQLFRHAFDKDTPAQFLAVTVIGSIYALYIIIKSERFRFSKLPIIGAVALVLTQAISTLQSGDILASLLGDSGRFVGSMSTLALLIVSIFHTQFQLRSFFTLLAFYIAAVEAVVIIGIAQHFNLVELPGDEGMSSTLGNSDFFAAFVGTAFPLLALLAIGLSPRGRVFIALVALVNVVALYWAGPLQAYVDIAFTVLGLSLFAVKRFIPRPQWTLNARTFLAGFAVVIWAEFIFLMPFLGEKVPVLGNDPQVKIRSNFWLAATRQFTDRPFFGVGPDQYGNYYEQYRTFDDVVRFPNILSNDAHSASVQTLATLGIFGTAAFLFLITLVARSLFILWDTQKIRRSYTLVLAIYIFVYLTNAFISPITLSHKFIFWAICGFIVGQAYRLPTRRAIASSPIKISIALAGVAIFSAGVVSTYGQALYLVNIEKYANDNKKDIKVVSSYDSPFILPCFAYFDAELLMAHSQGDAAAIAFAEKKIKKSPRCTAASISLGRIAANSDNLPQLKIHLDRLLTIAPYRSDTLSLAMYYANRTSDSALKAVIEREMKTLGLIYIPGKLG